MAAIPKAAFASVMMSAKTKDLKIEIDFSD